MTVVVPPLPPRLRASLPAELRGVRRDRVRLMVLDRARRTIEQARFNEVGRWLRPRDLLVVNTSRTVPAAIAARRADGSMVQLRLCVRRTGSAAFEEWDALSVEPAPPHANVSLSAGEVLRVGDVDVTVLAPRTDIPFLWRVRVPTDGLDLLLRSGEPIRYSYVPAPVDPTRYQTVYAARPGSAEPPSAGRPFSWELLRSLRERGIDMAEIVLHTGLSSFQDDAFDAEHHLYEEWYEVPDETVSAVKMARATGRVIAVGTTVVRALESAARDGELRATSGWTELAIRPGYAPRVVDGLVTGFHEPQASHFDLLRAFVDEQLLARAYAEAVSRDYLWHEFGDAMLIL